uniref:Cytochrome c oxidase subunit 2 n=1 Tax=Dolichoris vasculosae TaxID=130022 RepID=A0A8A2F8X0_9HYME|nr:cytochrome c oxidase subunit II [Dolichoris vasculosae]
MAFWGQLSLQNPATPLAQQMDLFHDLNMTVCLWIFASVIYFATYVLINKGYDYNYLHSEFLETLWLVLPVIAMTILTFPSLYLLYMVDTEAENPLFTVKAIGHQWYWTYEYNDIVNKEFDSYMLTKMSKKWMFRLLDVDNFMVLPMKSSIRLLTTSTDVIHAFAVPSLGIKVDAVPGRINQMNLYVSRPGVYFGQCSEICGVNHSFMPIGIEVISMKNFLTWLKK